MFKNRTTLYLFSSIGALILAAAVYNIPFVNEKLAWRVDALRSQLVYFLRPPEQAVFVPGQENADTTPSLPTPQVRTITATPPNFTPTPGPTSTPTITPTALPASVNLHGDKFYVDQLNRWNYCGPANLTMALNFWGWKGNRDDVAKIIRPGINDPKLDFIQRGRDDKNVMPYEMEGFVNNDTGYRALTRYGGNINLLKNLLTNGFPAIIEKGYYQRDTNGKVSWMGHYLFVTGYDDSQASFLVQDAYYLDGEKPKKNLPIKYDEFLANWRSFNYLFIVLYPPDRQNDLFNALGPWQDANYGINHSLDVNLAALPQTIGIDRFFTLFSLGTAYTNLQDYDTAAKTYDAAFKVYAQLPDDGKRPYRMMWYQTWPYWAYYYTGRYQDVVNLANVTLNETIAKPTLEESLYWRGRGELALGDRAAATKDFLDSVYYNPNFAPGLQQLQELGVTQ